MGEVMVPLGGGFVMFGLATAYGLRVGSTRDMQALGYIAGSDALVLVCPICEWDLFIFFAGEISGCVVSGEGFG